MDKCTNVFNEVHLLRVMPNGCEIFFNQFKMVDLILAALQIIVTSLKHLLQPIEVLSPAQQPTYKRLGGNYCAAVQFLCLTE